MVNRHVLIHQNSFVSNMPFLFNSTIDSIYVDTNKFKIHFIYNYCLNIFVYIGIRTHTNTHIYV